MSFVVLIWKLRPRVSQPLFLDRLKLFSHTNEGIGTLDKTGIWRRGGGKAPTSLRKQYFESYFRRSTIGASFVRTCVPWRRHLSFYFKTSCWTLPPSISLLLLLLYPKVLILALISLGSGYVRGGRKSGRIRTFVEGRGGNKTGIKIIVGRTMSINETKTWNHQWKLPEMKITERNMFGVLIARDDRGKNKNSFLRASPLY